MTAAAGTGSTAVLMEGRKVALAAVDATACGMDGTVIWARRAEGRLERMGRSAEAGTATGAATTGVGWVGAGADFAGLATGAGAGAGSSFLPQAARTMAEMARARTCFFMVRNTPVKGMEPDSELAQPSAQLPTQLAICRPDHAPQRGIRGL